MGSLDRGQEQADSATLAGRSWQRILFDLLEPRSRPVGYRARVCHDTRPQCLFRNGVRHYLHWGREHRRLG